MVEVQLLFRSSVMRVGAACYPRVRDLHAMSDYSNDDCLNINSNSSLSWRLLCSWVAPARAGSSVEQAAIIIQITTPSFSKLGKMPTLGKSSSLRFVCSSLICTYSPLQIDCELLLEFVFTDGCEYFRVYKLLNDRAGPFRLHPPPPR